MDFWQHDGIGCKWHIICCKESACHEFYLWHADFFIMMTFDEYMIYEGGRYDGAGRSGHSRHAAMADRQAQKAGHAVEGVGTARCARIRIMAARNSPPLFL